MTSSEHGDERPTDAAIAGVRAGVRAEAIARLEEALTDTVDAINHDYYERIAAAEGDH